MWMSTETRSKVESCRRNPMHFADATKNRSDDVKQWDYERKRDLDAFEELPPSERGWWTGTAGAAMDWRRRRNKSLETLFCFEDCCRETSTRCRGKRQTSQEIQVWRVRIMQLGAAVARNAQMGKIAQVGKSHVGGTIDPEHRHERAKVQNWKMNQNKQVLADSCERSRVRRDLQEPVHESSIPLGWLHPGCVWILTHDWGMTRTRHCDEGVARPELKVTQMRVRDAVDHENCLSTRFEIHKIQVQDGNCFLHDHVLRDQNSSKESIHDMLMNDWYWWKRDMKGLKQQVQDDRLLSINAFEPGMTGHDLANVGRNSHYKFFHELTGALLDPRTSETCQDQRGCVPAHDERESLWIRS